MKNKKVNYKILVIHFFIVSLQCKPVNYTNMKQSKQIKTPKQPPKPKIPFDKLWKSMVTDHFEDFLEMFMPELHQEVDYTVPFLFLEQELKAALIDKSLKQVDKLVGVQLKSGKQEWVYVHVEFENSHNPSIKERMYDYNARIKEKYKKDITALVIYTGRNAPANPNCYTKTVFGTSILFTFNAYVIVEQDKAALKANPNPFAIVVLANLYVANTYEDYAERLRLKEEIYVLARQRKYPDEKINRLILFLTELMKLPTNLETQFNEYISKPQKSTDMIYTTQTSRNMVDALAKEAFGQSVTEMDTTVTNAITRLYSKLKMSIEDIADFLEIEANLVLEVLKKNKLIKNK
jgi:Putative transposase, YhgA-like